MWYSSCVMMQLEPQIASRLVLPFGTAANSGSSQAQSKGFCEEDMTLMEIEMLVGYVMIEVADNLTLDGVCCRSPFVDGGGKYLKAEWVRKI